MLNIPKLADLDLKDKRVLVRADLDVDISANGTSESDTNHLRLQVLKPTIDFIFEKDAKAVILLGHRGRPQLENDYFSTVENNKNLSLEPLVGPLETILARRVAFLKSKSELNQDFEGKILLLENLRFDKREEENSSEFAEELSALGDIYVNEAFAVSHRKHASLSALAMLFREKKSAAAGLRFCEEIEKLSKVFEKPKRPVVVIIGGAKEDKLDYIEGFLGFADKILIGGKLPEYINNYSKYDLDNPKILIAELVLDKTDISPQSVDVFREEINQAATLVVAGPMGKYEDVKSRKGTQEVFGAGAESRAYKVVGGGDSESAVRLLGLEDKFDWISVGGGAALEFLTKKTLPGIEALI